MNDRSEARRPAPPAPDELAERYRRDGFAFPCRALPEGEALRMGRHLRALLGSDPRTARYLRDYPHLVFSDADRLAHDERVLDAVERILGPDLLIWSSGFFVKAPRSADYVSWHQDLTYWGLSGTEQVSAWLALSPVTVANGCMRFVPGSHRRPIEAHVDTFAGDNQLSRGQELAVEVDEADAVPVTLAPGELSLHHGRLFHASGANRTDGWRIGITLIYVTPAMRQVVARKDYAQLVRGRDPCNHFGSVPRPRFDFDPISIKAHAELTRAKSEALYQGAARRPEGG